MLGKIAETGDLDDEQAKEIATLIENYKSTLDYITPSDAKDTPSDANMDAK